jgi:hypothetical protein
MKVFVVLRRGNPFCWANGLAAGWLGVDVLPRRDI